MKLVGILGQGIALGQGRRGSRGEQLVDVGLFVAVIFLLGFGLLMVTSASMPMANRIYGNPFFFVERHMLALGLALAMGCVCFAIPPRVWERSGVLLFVGAISLLIIVLVPGVGRTVNGATRWIPLGVLNLQPAEAIKFLAVIYLSGYLVRRQSDVIVSVIGSLRPMVLVGLASIFILAQPDFGTTAVLLATVMALLFLGGVPLWQFALLFLLVASALAALIWLEPYRLERVTSFMNAFDDPFDTDFQLSNALIALGRGEWFGVGLGNGIQKQFYLPEAHTDFLLAVIGEEFGLVGVILVVSLFAFVVWRAFNIGVRARAQGDYFGGYVCHGLGLMLGLQAIVNAGVNTGLLPTKGLTLPFLSYGSNALIVAVMAIGILLRIDVESRRKLTGSRVQGVEPWREGRWQRA